MSNGAICGVEGCTEKLYSKKTACCLGHHIRMKKHGTAMPDVPLRKTRRPGGTGTPHYTKTLSDGETKRGFRDRTGRIRHHGVQPTGFLEAPGR